MNIAILTDADQEHPEKILYSSVKQPFYATETCYFKGSSLDSPIKLNMRLLIDYDVSGPAGRIL